MQIRVQPVAFGVSGGQLVAQRLGVVLQLGDGGVGRLQLGVALAQALFEVGQAAGFAAPFGAQQVDLIAYSCSDSSRVASPASASARRSRSPSSSAESQILLGLRGGYRRQRVTLFQRLRRGAQASDVVTLSVQLGLALRERLPRSVQLFAGLLQLGAGALQLAVFIVEFGL